MALDGSCDIVGPHDRITSKPSQHQHVVAETEVVEEDLVVLFHAGSLNRPGHAAAHPDKG